jgi:hypothetical protein
MLEYYKAPSLAECTLNTCNLDEAYINYLPSIASNTFFLVLFSTVACIQLLLGVHYRTWGLMVRSTISSS